MKIEAGSKVFLDSNVLLEASESDRKFHEKAVSLFKDSASAGINLFLGTQVLREYLVVATRPVQNNGLGLPRRHALDNLERIRQRAVLFPESKRAALLFLRWVERFEISGKRLHDLQLFATATTSGVDYFVTINVRDFPKVEDVQVLSLAELEW